MVGIVAVLQAGNIQIHSRWLGCFQITSGTGRCRLNPKCVRFVGIQCAYQRTIHSHLSIIFRCCHFDHIVATRSRVRHNKFLSPSINRECLLIHMVGSCIRSDDLRNFIAIVNGYLFLSPSEDARSRKVAGCSCGIGAHLNGLTLLQTDRHHRVACNGACRTYTLSPSVVHRRSGSTMRAIECTVASLHQLSGEYIYIGISWVDSRHREQRVIKDRLRHLNNIIVTQSRRWQDIRSIKSGRSIVGRINRDCVGCRNQKTLVINIGLDICHIRCRIRYADLLNRISSH